MAFAAAVSYGPRFRCYVYWAVLFTAVCVLGYGTGAKGLTGTGDGFALVAPYVMLSLFLASGPYLLSVYSVLRDCCVSPPGDRLLDVMAMRT